MTAGSAFTPPVKHKLRLAGRTQPDTCLFAVPETAIVRLGDAVPQVMAGCHDIGQGLAGRRPDSRTRPPRPGKSFIVQSRLKQKP